MDMEAVIGEALEFADGFIKIEKSSLTCPIFPNKEV
jgi:hypothetical protein